jgi:cell division protein FtsN
LAQDDYYYEIQLTNKQLVFYFMAGAAGLILSFLAGVMVGRGVDPGAGASVQAQQITEGKVVSEEPPPTPSEYSYPQRLEADRPSAALERPRPQTTPPAPAAAAPTPTPAPARPTPTPAPPPKPQPTPLRAAPSLPPALAPDAAGHAVQVGAFKDKASADSVMRGLQAKGMPAYVKSPAPQSGGLFTVRVGPYRDRADADLVAARLKADQFKPYIIKQ